MHSSGSRRYGDRLPATTFNPDPFLIYAIQLILQIIVAGRIFNIGIKQAGSSGKMETEMYGRTYQLDMLTIGEQVPAIGVKSGSRQYIRAIRSFDERNGHTNKTSNYDKM